MGPPSRALSVVIATGATPRRLDIPSEARLQGKGVSNCAVCDGFFFKGKKVAVVGGGDTAMEEATFFTNLAPRSRSIHRRGRAEGVRRPAGGGQVRPQDNFNWNSVVTDILGNGKVEGLAIKDLKTGKESKLEVDGVFIAIGYDPNTKLFQGQAGPRAQRLHAR